MFKKLLSFKKAPETQLKSSPKRNGIVIEPSSEITNLRKTNRLAIRALKNRGIQGAIFALFFCFES